MITTFSAIQISSVHKYWLLLAELVRAWRILDVTTVGVSSQKIVPTFQAWMRAPAQDFRQIMPQYTRFPRPAH
jgi:hypothetical protein